MKCYHGTTDSVQIDTYIKPPVETGVLREDFRKKNLAVVYFTPYKETAIKFAVKSARKFGGNPIIYEVEEPDFWWYGSNKTECITDKWLTIINKCDIVT